MHQCEGIAATRDCPNMYSWGKASIRWVMVFHGILHTTLSTVGGEETIDPVSVADVASEEVGKQHSVSCENFQGECLPSSLFRSWWNNLVCGSWWPTKAEAVGVEIVAIGIQ